LFFGEKMRISPSSAWRNNIRRYQLPIEICGKCGKKNLSRDICPYCGTRIVPEGENILRSIGEGRDLKINGQLKICVPRYGGKERGG